MGNFNNFIKENFSLKKDILNIFWYFDSLIVIIFLGFIFFSAFGVNNTDIVSYYVIVSFIYIIIRTLIVKDLVFFIFSVIVICFLAILCSSVFLPYKLADQKNNWKQFKDEQHCKIVSVGSGFSGNKIGWLCDDGITYYNNYKED